MARLPVQEVRAGYGELGLIEQPVIALLATLGWHHKNLYSETFGPLGGEGRARASIRSS